VWTTRPRRAASPRSPSKNTSGTRKARSRATRYARRDATTTGMRPLQLTRLERALKRLLEARRIRRHAQEALPVP
jgi:hypothetical protein